MGDGTPGCVRQPHVTMYGRGYVLLTTIGMASQCLRVGGWLGWALPADNGLSKPVHAVPRQGPPNTFQMQLWPVSKGSSYLLGQCHDYISFKLGTSVTATKVDATPAPLPGVGWQPLQINTRERVLCGSTATRIRHSCCIIAASGAMMALQLQQALVDVGTVGGGGSAAAARPHIAALCQRLGLGAESNGDLKQQFSDLLSHLLAHAPSLLCSYVADYVVAAAALASADPDEAFVLQPSGALTAWLQHAAAVLQRRLGSFLQDGLSAQHGVAVLDLVAAARALASVAHTLQAACATSSDRCVQAVSAGAGAP